MNKLAWITVGVVALTVGQVHGQNALGNGRGLDNNLQVGAGGTNPAGQQMDFQAGNNIVTGNSGGLSRFHGRVGYSAPGEFSGNLPSNGLFRFRARAVQSSPTEGGYSLGPTTVYRSGSGVSAGDVANSAGNQLIVPPSIDAVSPYQTSLLPSTSISGRGYSIGSVRQEDGSRLQISATPLTGVTLGSRRVGDLTPRTLDLGSPIGGQASVARDNMTLIGVNDEQLGGDRLSTPDPFAPAADDTGINTRLDAQPATPTNAKDDINLQLEALEARLSQRRGTPHPIADKSARQPGAQQNVYGQILDAVAQNQQQPQGDTMARPFAPQTDDKAAARSTPMDPFGINTGTPGAQQQQPSPTMSPLEMQRMLQAQRQAIQESKPDSMGGAAAIPDAAEAPTLPQAPKDNWFLPENMKPAAPPAIPGDSQSNTGELDQLATSVDYNMPIIGSLASATDSKADRLLRQAEKQLANQRYFDADDTYLTVLRLRPDDPMAGIGQVHAQIGVGMIRTASFKLRRLLLEHPELISARYDKKLLPAAQRLRWVQEELTEMSRHSTSVEPPLMLAYLGYQLENMQQVRSALDQALQRKPNDPVVLLLRRVWLKNPPASQ